MRKCLPWALLPLASQLWGVVADAHPAAAVGERHLVAQVEFVTAHAALRLEVMVERLGPWLRESKCSITQPKIQFSNLRSKRSNVESLT